MKKGELDELFAFVTIARTRSFTRAAAELNLSPSALSHTIKALELRLGVRLLARTTRSVAPTAAGERLLRSVEPAFREVQAGVTALGDWQREPHGNIRLTTFSYAAHAVLGASLPKFLLDHPKVSVEVVLDSKLIDLIAEGFDAGIRFGESLDQDMIAVPVGPAARMAIVGSPAYFERHPRPQTPSDLDAHNCVNYRQIGSGGLLPWEFERDGKEFRVRTSGQLVVDDGDLAATAVVAGAGLGYMLEGHALPYIAKGQLIRVLEEWCTPFAGLHLCYPNRQPSPALRALIDALRWTGP
ncbi:LysR family transcriptional regulator [Luteibacter pinisoli]|uniref:LysR family transcriptional regulator n=1 Tax=Luteibacter pinisoli TaxID=2589080 RepID=A0A4Y5Z325_9GAMM|nr:LysR family transcriptional regulator [Luteibacter pinisoli]QDE39497.1 LysR family transcriptional regulator [Luteibacter pinisoli]